MANDRLYLVCKRCAEHKVLYKYYPSPDAAYAVTEGLNDFITKHVFECQELWFSSLGTETVFTLETEETSFRKKKEEINAEIS